MWMDDCDPATAAAQIPTATSDLIPIALTPEPRTPNPESRLPSS